MAKKKTTQTSDEIIDTPETLETDNTINEPKVNEKPITKVSTPKDEKVFAYCCVHGGILFNLSTGKLFLPSANEVSVKNQFLNFGPNPNKYSVTEISRAQMDEIKQKFGSAKFMTNKFVFFSKESTLPKSIEAEMLKIRGKSPWEQMSDEDIERFGVKKKTED